MQRLTMQDFLVILISIQKIITDITLKVGSFVNSSDGTSKLCGSGHPTDPKKWAAKKLGRIFFLIGHRKAISDAV